MLFLYQQASRSIVPNLRLTIPLSAFKTSPPPFEYLLPFLIYLLQGCCTSRPADASPNTSPYSPSASQTHHGDSSSRAITTSAIPPSNSGQPHLQPSLTQSASNTSTPRRSNQSSTRAPNPLPLSEHYNFPVRRHIWRSTARTWTASQLFRERSEFFDTRVTGRVEIWGALCTASEFLRSEDVATAQTIIDAAGITVPTGDLCDGCYDEAGNLYRMPEPVVADPENLQHGTGPGDDIGNAGSVHHTGTLAEAKTIDDSDEEEAEEALEQRREEKGKRAERDTMKIRCRLSDRGGPDVVVTIGKSQTVGVLARRVQSEALVS